MELTRGTGSQSSNSVTNVADPDHSETVSSHPTLRVPPPEPIHVGGNSKFKRQKRSLAWQHYTMKKEDGGTYRTDKAVCNYCGTPVSYDSRRNGTSSLIYHLKNTCIQNPLCEKMLLFEKRDKRQRTLVFRKTDSGLQLAPWKSNQDKGEKDADS